MPEQSVIASFWLWQFMGRLHPLVVHFPIGLLFVALVLEIFAWRKNDQTLRTSQHIVLLISVGSAVIAAAFGLLLKDQDEYLGDTLTIHQYAGIVTALLSIITFYFFRLCRQYNGTHLLYVYRACLICSTIGVTIAGHYGAS